MKSLIIILLSLSLCACSTAWFKEYVIDVDALRAPENRAAVFALGQSLANQGSDIQWRNAYERQQQQQNLNNAMLLQMMMNQR